MYPRVVEDKLREIFPHFKDFMEEANVHPDVLAELLMESMTEKFIKGEEEAVWEEHEMETILGKAVFLSALKGLKEKGLVDSVEDETGEEVIFMTEEGKKIAEFLFGPKIQTDPSEQKSQEHDKDE